MYKQSDIVKIEDIPQDKCEVCYLHKKAYEFFEDKELDENIELCPYCNTPMDNYAHGYDNRVVVGGHNSYTPNEKIGYYKVYECTNCSKTFAAIPQEIMYNANHNIFFTGGVAFLNKTDEKMLMSKIEEEMKINTKEFVERVKNDNSLADWNLSYWNQNSIKQAISEFLYEKGLKI